MHVACNYHYLGWVLTCKYLKQGFWGKILVFGLKITNFENCVLFMQYLQQTWIDLNIIFCMWLVTIIILDGFLHGNI